MSDAAGDVLNDVITALRSVFTATSPSPPLGGGTDDVRLFAGDAIPLAAWDAHVAGTGCDGAFLWVRLVRRYRSRSFPAPTVTPAACSDPSVIAVEAGVGRCAVVEAEPSWADYEREAEISLDDSFRLEVAMCRAMSAVLSSEHGVQTALDSVVPYGPEGGVIAWVATAYVQL